MIRGEEDSDRHVRDDDFGRLFVVPLIPPTEPALTDLSELSVVDLRDLAIFDDDEVVQILGGAGVGEIRGAGEQRVAVANDEFLVEDGGVEVGSHPRRGAQEGVLDDSVFLVLAGGGPWLRGVPALR